MLARRIVGDVHFWQNYPNLLYIHNPEESETNRDTLRVFPVACLGLVRRESNVGFHPSIKARKKTNRNKHIFFDRLKEREHRVATAVLSVLR